MGFSRQEHRRGLPCPPPGDPPNLGIEPGPEAACSLHSACDASPTELRTTYTPVGCGLLSTSASTHHIPSGPQAQMTNTPRASRQTPFPKHRWALHPPAWPPLLGLPCSWGVSPCVAPAEDTRVRARDSSDEGAGGRRRGSTPGCAEGVLRNHLRKQSHPRQHLREHRGGAGTHHCDHGDEHAQVPRAAGGLRGTETGH